MRREGPSAGSLPFPLTCRLPYLQAAEILIALKKLGEKLKPSEEAFLAQNKTASMADFEAVGEEVVRWAAACTCRLADIWREARV